MRNQNGFPYTVPVTGLRTFVPRFFETLMPLLNELSFGSQTHSPSPPGASISFSGLLGRASGMHQLRLPIRIITH